MRNNYDRKIPCHRVIKSNGEPGGYNGGEREKELRLRAEGARLDREKNVKYTITGIFGVQN